MDDFKVEGKVPVVMERFTIEKIVGDIALEIFFSTVVGTGSRSLDTSSKEAKDDLSKVIGEAMENKMMEEEEELERAKRKTSVIIHGVPESKSQQANESRRRQKQH